MIVEIVEEEELTASGIVLPDTAKEKQEAAARVGLNEPSPLLPDMPAVRIREVSSRGEVAKRRRPSKQS